MAAEHLLFLHCKQGNLSEVKYVVEVKGVDLNIRDRWDSTPLYYACLCGHKEIVEYLLRNGSKCESSTFDGERCLYGALTNDIRNLLRNWKQIHSTGKRRDRYYELLRQMYEDKTYKDIIFKVHDVKIEAHRFLLVARSSFFAEALSSKWQNKGAVVIKHDRVSVEAFRAMLQFLYLGRVDVRGETVLDLKLLANYCKLSHLLEEVVKAEEKLLELVKMKPSMGNKVKILTVESETSLMQLSDDLRQFMELTLPAELRMWIDEGVLPFSDFNDNFDFYPDICVRVEGRRFFCHKVCLLGQSDYFKALIADHFHENVENETAESLPMITLRDISAEIFKHILVYIYSGKTEFQSFDDAMEILTIADMMLLSGLKRSCGNVIAQCVDTGNVVEIYRCSQSFDLPNLTDRCTNYMARELESLLESEDFTDLVMEEAFSVQNREETDSIPVVDDIRYHITSAVATYGQVEEVKERLARLEVMLARLGIEC